MASPMALTRCLPVFLLVAMTATTGASANFYVKCYPPPTPTPDGGSAFRGNLLSLLEALLSAAALTGFASLQTDGRTASDRALVRGLCSDDSAPEPCRRCLADGGKKLTEQCGDASRRAAFWDERCFVVYADGANSSAIADDEFGAVFFTGDAVLSPDIVSVQRLVALAQSLAQRAANSYGSVASAVDTTLESKGDATTGNRTVLVLAKCHGGPGLREASLAMARSWLAGGGAKGRASTVLGSNCYLLFEISTPPLPPPPPPPTLEEMIMALCAAFMKGVVIGMVVGVLIGMVLCALMEVYDRMRMKARNNRNAAAAVEAMSGK